MLALGAFAVHQLRYLIAHGSDSSATLAEHGHAYLAAVATPLAGLVLAALAATLLLARFGGAVRRRAPLAPLLYALALIAIYSGQELIEGAASAGHPGGAEALIGGAGWIAVPLALALGSLVALVMRALEGIESALAPAPAPTPLPAAPRSQGGPRPASRLTPLLAPLAFGLARRPPPAPAFTCH